jgi:hypothetical protein
MKFLCIIWEDPEQVKQIPKPQLDKIVKEYMAFTKDLEKAKQLEAGESLEPGHTPTTIRMNHGKALATYGPHEPLQYTIGGFYLIHAKDHKEAVEIMTRVPGLQMGMVEIRPVYDWSAQHKP